MSEFWYRSKVGAVVSNTLVILGAIAAWQVLSMLFPSQYLISPYQTVQEFFRLMDKGYGGASLWDQVYASVFRTLIGYFLAVLIGTPLGIWMGISKFAHRIFSPLFSIMRPVPTIALIPLIILWLGIGETSKIVIIFFTTLIFYVVAVAGGVANIPSDYKNVAQNYGASRTQTFFSVLLPGSLPAIVSGLRIALGIAWSILVAAELIAAQKGIGFMILDAAQFLRIPAVYVGIVIIGAIGYVSDALLQWAGEKIVHWEGV